MITHRISPEERVRRFWGRVIKTEGCWLWSGPLDKCGYGSTYRVVDGKFKTIGAHVMSYEEIRGPVPSGLELDHLCRVRHCVNPDHLEAVSHRVNMMRGGGVGSSNAVKTHCIHGHPFSDNNTYLRRCGRRACRECGRRSQSEYEKRKRGMKAA